MRFPVLSRFLHPDPRIRRELVELLYTSLPQVMAIGVTSVTGALALTLLGDDPGYAVITFFILVTATARVFSLMRYKARAARFTDADVVRWERLYGAGATAFGLALGALSFRALQLGDAPGAWIAFGLSMSYCVGMVSRAAIRPWIILTAAAALLMPTMIAGLMRPELAYKIGAGMLVLFWLTLREASKHLSAAFTERLEAKHRLARQATHDFLTDLPNRAGFLQALSDMAGNFTVVAIDLDGFKPINDRHGHHTGDDLLRQVAERLTTCVGADGVAARFGGDEFMLLKPVTSAEQGRDEALALARKAVFDLSMPYLLADLPVCIGASAGIAVSHAALTGGNTAQLLERVDRALYVAKRAGGGCAWADGDIEPSCCPRSTPLAKDSAAA
ncbi:GGDEF domain-containing protein [Rhodopseudomonas palustris]|uniref:GGDEF domain-containing protein n=1 Tax=Rhodopseudomonas palustris TaxID=1076 RepID=UPI000CECCC0E|nr:diguanylate cyclase [Rhodopseudomonas palustris]PPQ45274.1 GGDEF domain-containing protein [Rhodopseudomonas palustris]WBU28207.1 diguanylate cyclase [Rhodopseudomonas palustris]